MITCFVLGKGKALCNIEVVKAITMHAIQDDCAWLRYLCKYKTSLRIDHFNHDDNFNASRCVLAAPSDNCSVSTSVVGQVRYRRVNMCAPAFHSASLLLRCLALSAFVIKSLLDALKLATLQGQQSPFTKQHKPTINLISTQSSSFEPSFLLLQTFTRLKATLESPRFPL